MLIQDQKVKIIKFEQKSGVSSKGKPYSMPTIQIVDDQFNKFEVIVPKSLAVGNVVPEWILEAKDLDCVMDLEIVPRGYGVSFNVVDIREE